MTEDKAVWLRVLTIAYTCSILALGAQMEFAGFDWDGGNRKKCQKHGLSIAEIESVFERPVVVLPDKENIHGERRFRAIGTTAKKRHAFIVFTQRDHGHGSLIRPISARYMHRKEVESYEKTYPHL